MTCEFGEHPAMKLAIDGLVALGTLAVAVLAIWGDWIRSKLAPAKLEIELHTPQGDPTTTVSGTRLMFYHLRVINRRPWLPALNCRVLLKGLMRRGPDNIFHPTPMAVPTQFVWAPAEITPPVITLVREQVLDFGIIAENGQRFEPRLYSFAVNFGGFVQANEAVRYQLQIEASNFPASRIQVFEVAWDGQWDFNSATMSQHLRLREISPNEN